VKAGERWRALPVGGRVVLVIVAAIVAVDLVLAAVENVTGGSGPGGRQSSSYATKPGGLAAYADLLAGEGHPVHRLRARVTDEVDAGSTLVIADVRLEGDEIAAVGRFLDRGGRLVAAGEAVTPALARLVAGDVEWAPDAGPISRPVLPVAPGLGDLDLLGTVRTMGIGRWADAGGALPVLAAGQDTIAAVAGRGAGTVVMLADASPLQNALLAQAGNAGFGLAAAGAAPRPVVFAEAGHGYGQRSGLGAVPRRWKEALAGLALATLVWMWSRGRRLGPPDRDDEPPPPARRAYVDALAVTLLRTKDPAAAIAPVQEEARARLARRAGLAPTDTDGLRTAAAGLGIAPHDVDAILTPAHTDDDAVRAARALARLGERHG
jgi:hypothetical protein